MTISAGDWTVFFSRKLSVSLLVLAALAIIGPFIYRFIKSRWAKRAAS